MQTWLLKPNFDLCLHNVATEANSVVKRLLLILLVKSITLIHYFNWVKLRDQEKAVPQKPQIIALDPPGQVPRRLEWCSPGLGCIQAALLLAPTFLLSNGRGLTAELLEAYLSIGVKRRRWP